VTERNAADHLHGEIARISVLPHAVKGDEVLVLDGCGAARLADEAPAGGSIGGEGRR
jgi:hypothetical protein